MTMSGWVFNLWASHFGAAPFLLLRQFLGAELKKLAEGAWE